MNETKNAPEFQQFINVINNYETALSLLDDYDHRRMSRPTGHDTTYILTYEECRRLIDTMRFNGESDLFGHEKDDSFKGSIGDIYLSVNLYNCIFLLTLHYRKTYAYGKPKHFINRSETNFRKI